MAEVQLFLTRAEDAKKRLDHFLQESLAGVSRSRVQEWIKAGRVRVGGAVAAKASLALRGGEQVEVEAASPEPLAGAFAEAIPLSILYEDESVIAVDKPAGMVVHMGAGNRQGTLVNALLHRFGASNLSASSSGGADDRPGIVHRLDRDTSGVLLVARNDTAHRALAAQFAARTVEKSYAALVHGQVKQEHAFIDKPIERDPVRRIRMTARSGRGRAALTEYRVTARCAEPKLTLLDVRIHTGRTHQIRAHLAAIGHPVVGDTLYGAASKPPVPITRFFLHARRIGFTSPESGKRVEVAAPLPADLAEALRAVGMMRES